jgi:phosphoglycolate phosphatase
MTPPLRGATIVFDLDGTLVDTAPDLAAAANHVFKQIGLADVPPEAMHPFIGHGSRAMIDAGLRLHKVEVAEAEVDRLHALFFDYYVAHIADFSRPFEQVPETLDALRAAGARLAVCTNKFEALSVDLLEKLGLLARFQVVAGRDTFDVCKPAPGHLTGAIARAGGDPKRAVMVGDSEVDFATAHAANVPSIGVTFGYTPRPVRELGPGIIINHYQEFLPALAKVLPPG